MDTDAMEPAVSMSSDSARLGGHGRNAAPPPRIIYARPRGAPFCMGSEKSKELLDSMLENQNKMLENQRKMMHMIVETISNVNHISQNLKAGTAVATAGGDGTEEPQTTHSAGLPVPPVPSYSSSNFMDPVNSVEALKALEESLKDDNLMRKYVNNMSFICGTSGRANGIDCCYKLVDYFITRQFLLQCSWTGNSRVLGAGVGGKPTADGGELMPEGESGKVALKFYRQFRKLFLNLIMLADNTFNEMQCEMFFKRIMKNSKQRLMSKTHTSKHRNRPKNLKYKIQRPSTSNEPSVEMAENNEPFEDIADLASSHSESSSAVEYPSHSYVPLSSFHHL